jgi:Protein of unknown function (DUF2384)
MSDDKPAEPQAERPAAPWTKQFRRKGPSTLPTPEQLRRQEAVLRCAWRNLGGSGPVIAFLNSHNERLGGQPLHLALGSDEGLLRVERLLGEIGQGLSAAKTTLNGQHDEP